jgi:HprK-related kinase A
LKVGELSRAELTRRLQGNGLRLRNGPAVVCVTSRLPEVRNGIALHYAGHEVPPDDRFTDFHVGIDRPAGLRRWFRPQIQFTLDGERPFAPLPGDQGFPMFEWGMNWCLSMHMHRFLIIHAAVIERGGRAMILPAPPGSGKSTLCAGLVWRGWRLLSDELTLIDPLTGRITPVARPVSLKNASIDVIRQFAPQARFGPVVPETVKGSIGHFSPPPGTLENSLTTALPGWVVLPRFVAGAPTQLTPLSRARAVMALADNAFNYNVHGANGFHTLTNLVGRSDCFEFSYSRLDEAVALFAQLADAPASPRAEAGS